MWNVNGKCIKTCYGGSISKISNSNYSSGSGGTVYNSSANVIDFNTANIGNSYYSSGYIIKGVCASGYSNVGDIKYTCSDGSWINSGSCMKSCTVSNPSNGYYKLNNSTTLANGAAVVHGNSVTMACNGGYLLTGSAVATCNNGSWNFSSNNGNCEKLCVGKPNLDAGSVYSSSLGTFYDTNMKTVAANSSSYARHGAIFNVSCSSNYQEIYLIDSAYNSNNGNKKEWGHYYYCNNGNWVSVGRCLAKGSKTFNYTGASQTFTPPINSGEKIALTLEVWGAQEGGGNGGYGGYTIGKYNAVANTILSIVVGGKGENSGKNNNGGKGGYNGGGNAGIGCGGSKGTGSGGGGKTNIDLNDTSLIIAGGGGGGSESNGNSGGNGAGNNNSGGDGGGQFYGHGGTNSAGGASSGSCTSSGVGKKGLGGNGCSNGSGGKYCPGGGGGGYYGGGGGDWASDKDRAGSGGGGSGFCGNGAYDCRGSNGYNDSNTVIDGKATNGNGYAKISW